MTEIELRNNVVNIAKEYIGITMGSAKHKEIVNIYNTITPHPRGYALKTSDNWCAGYASAMFKKANLIDIFPAEVSCYYMIEGFKKIGRWQENDAYVPQIGDVILYDWDDNGVGDNTNTPDHVGIVVLVKDGMITVIEGNKGSPSQVGYRTIAVNGRYIRGYGLPNFASKATKAATEPPKTNTPSVAPVVKVDNSVKMPTLQYRSSGNYVRFLQYILNYFGYNCGTVDGDFGGNTKAAVIKFQKAKNLTADGIVGVNTWTAIRNALPEISKGYSGNCVRALQIILNTYGYNCGTVDGVFGNNTKSAVIKFQDKKNLVEDGIVGKLTWTMIFKGA